jgi:hypothetical protein
VELAPGIDVPGVFDEWEFGWGNERWWLRGCGDEWGSGRGKETIAPVYGEGSGEGLGTGGFVWGWELESGEWREETVPPVHREWGDGELFSWWEFDGDKKGEVVLGIAAAPIDGGWSGSVELSNRAIEGGLEKGRGKATAPFDRLGKGDVGFANRAREG